MARSAEHLLQITLFVCLLKLQHPIAHIWSLNRWRTRLNLEKPSLVWIYKIHFICNFHKAGQSAFSERCGALRKDMEGNRITFKWNIYFSGYLNVLNSDKCIIPTSLPYFRPFPSIKLFYYPLWMMQTLFFPLEMKRQKPPLPKL